MIKIIIILLVILFIFFISYRQGFVGIDENLKTKNVNFLFLVRDGESYLENNLNQIIKLGLYFKSYKIFFIENDSKDNTVNILKSMMSTNDSIIGKFKKIGNAASFDMCENVLNRNCNKRTRFLASLRQEVLDMSMDYESDLTIILDLDFKSFNKNQLIKMINVLYKIDADAIFGVSFHLFNTLPYDMGAIKPFNMNILKRLYKRNQLIQVDSAFSGFGVYRTSSIIKYKAKYDLNTDVIEHISFNKHFNDVYIYTSFRPNYNSKEMDKIEEFFSNFSNSRK